MGEVLKVAELVSNAWSENTQAEIKSTSRPHTPREHVWASGWRACTRAMALDMMHPEDRSEIDGDGRERITRGLAFEREVYSRLIHAGRYSTPTFEVSGSQEHFEVPGRDGRIIITGRVDGFIEFAGGPRIPYEVKGGESVRNIRRVEDFENSVWSRPMPYQLLTYMLASNSSTGLFVLNTAAKPTFLELSLENDTHLEMAERMLADAETACAAAREEAPLPPETDDRTECRRCDHRDKTCFPDIDFGEGMNVMESERLVALVRTRGQNEAAAKAFAKADKALKSELRGCRLGMIGGEYLVEGSGSRHTTYDLPEAVEREILKIKAPYRTVNPEGKWSVKIKRVEGAGEATT